MKYIYNDKEYQLPNFLRDHGNNFVLFWTDIMEENMVKIVELNSKNLIHLYNHFGNKNSFLGNINANSFMSLKEFLIPYKKQPDPAHVPEHLERLFYYIDFVKTSYKDFNLILEREENGFKSKIPFQSQQEALAKTGLKYLNPHVILRSFKNKEIFEPLYDIKTKNFYYQGAKIISPLNIFED